jgi:hypothetical protein
MLADPSGAPTTEQQPGAGGEPAGNGSGANGGGLASGEGTSPAGQGSACARCGAPLDPGQDWCLQCGSGAPGALDAGGPGWRSATTVLAVTAALVLGAAAAGYAALSKSSPAKPPPKVIVVAQAPDATAGVDTPGAVTPTTPTTPSTPTTPTPTPTVPPAGGLAAAPVKPLGTTAKPPKIPLTAATPKRAEATTPTNGTGSTGAGTGSTGAGTGTGTAKSPTKSSGGTGAGEQAQTPLLLDTNAASTYNPYGYPASEFGDPRLTIDGETSTAWTARVNPAVAPKMAEGVTIDLKSPQKIAALTLVTSTPGMTVQVYGANGSTLPGSITDPAWVGLSAVREVKKDKTQIKLRGKTKGFRWVVLWISKAPASAVGTPQAPGHVAVNELELFPPT